MSFHVLHGAEWMRAEHFAPDGPIEQAVRRVERVHGARVLTLWKQNLTEYAGERPITTSVMERHARQSLEHWAIYLAACRVSAQWRNDRASVHAGNDHLTPLRDHGRHSVVARARAPQVSGEQLRRSLGWRTR